MLLRADAAEARPVDRPVVTESAHLESIRVSLRTLDRIERDLESLRRRLESAMKVEAALSLRGGLS